MKWEILAMPLRFTRRFSLVPGLRVNLSKSGVSASIGHRGADQRHHVVRSASKPCAGR